MLLLGIYPGITKSQGKHFFSFSRYCQTIYLLLCQFALPLAVIRVPVALHALLKYTYTGPLPTGGCDIFQCLKIQILKLNFQGSNFSSVI